MPSSEEWAGEPHILTVRAIRLPDGPYDDGDLEDYDLKHPPSCGQEKILTWYGQRKVTHYTCDIAWQEEDIGLASALGYSGTPITGPGVYRIQGWGSKHYHFEYGDEYDAGVTVLEMIRRLSIVPPLPIDGHAYRRRQLARRRRHGR